jgi:hypothetical protein
LLKCTQQNQAWACSQVYQTTSWLSSTLLGFVQSAKWREILLNWEGFWDPLSTMFVYYTWSGKIQDRESSQSPPYPHLHPSPPPPKSHDCCPRCWRRQRARPCHWVPKVKDRRRHFVHSKIIPCLILILPDNQMLLETGQKPWDALESPSGGGEASWTVLSWLGPEAGAVLGWG